MVFSSTSVDWAVYSIDKTESLKLLETGKDLDEFKDEFDDSKLLFGIVRIQDTDTGLYKIVFISFLGDGVPVSSKGKYHEYVSVLSSFFKGFHVHIQARSEADVEPVQIIQKVKDASGAKYKVREMDVVDRDTSSRKSLPKEQDMKGYVSPVVSAVHKNAQIDKQKTMIDNPNKKRAEEEMQKKQEEMKAQERNASKERKELERLEREHLEIEQHEKEHVNKLRQERERLERLERERVEKERQESERLRQSGLVINETEVIDGISALALYDYQKDEDNEIDLREGENISNVTDLGEGWYSGTNSFGQTGLFPGNYVQVNVLTKFNDIGLPAVHNSTQEPTKCAVALYDYQAAEENEISFAAGDTITGITYPSEEWWHGFVNGIGGLFPGNYVERK